MNKHSLRSWCLGLGLAVLTTLATARPLLLPPTQQLQFPSPGAPAYTNQFDPFIYSVAIDGNTALVAAQRAIDTANNRANGVYLFERDAAGHWSYRGPLSEEPDLARGSQAVGGNVAALSGNSRIVVYERGAAGWTQSGVIALPQNGAAFRVVDGAVYVQLYNISYPSCEPPLRQYRKVAGAWQQTATIGPERCAYSHADVSQGRVVIGYIGYGGEPQPVPLQIFADDGSANWPLVATPQGSAGSGWPYLYAPYTALSGNTLYADFGYLFRDSGANHWVAAGMVIQPEIETNIGSSLSLLPQLRGNYLVLPGQEHDYEPPVVQDSGTDATYAWDILRVYRQRNDGGFDYYAKLNPENAIGMYGASSDGRRIIGATSGSNYQLGDYTRVFVFEVPDSVSFPGALQDDFESGSAARWTPSAGTFAVAQAGSTHVLRQSSIAGESGATYNNVDWTDQAIEADIRPTQFSGADRWFGLVARRTDAQNYYYVTFRSPGNIAIKRMRNGVFTTLLENYRHFDGFVAGHNYRVRFEAVGDQLAVFVNGKGIIHVKDSTFTHGHPGVAGYKASFDLDNVMLTSGTRTLLRDDGPVSSFTPVPSPNKTGTWNYLSLPDYQLAYEQSSIAGDARWVSKVPTGNQVVSTRVRPVGFGTSSSGQDQWVGIAAHYIDDNNYYYLTLRNSNRVSLRKLVNGAIQELGSASLPVTTGAWYDLRLEIVGSRLRAFVNNELEVETTDATMTGSGRNAMIMYKAAADYTDYFVYQP
jgi:hypothetical protein